MTLLETIQLIDSIAEREPNINTVTDDINDLNTDNYTAKYSAFTHIQNQHRISGDKITYNLTLYYIDRLAIDKKNRVEIQSTAIKALTNILLNLDADDRIDLVTDWNIITFSGKFEAYCAGAYVNIGLATTIDNTCAEIFKKKTGGTGDFNDDFNDDFYK